MYNGVITSVRTTGGETNMVRNTIGLHQGFALSPYLFALVIDDITKHIQYEILYCMLFVDDIVLIDETKAGINYKSC